MPRQTGAWPIPDEITFTICHYAGREASAALRIALGNTNGASAALEALFWEPLTYWDWHALPRHHDTAKKLKRQRMWEHRKGFKPVSGPWVGNPTSAERWEMFKQRVEEKEEWSGTVDVWVKRIAIGYFMN